MNNTPTEKQTRHAAGLTRQQKHRAIGIVAGEFSNPYTLTLLNEVTRQLHQRGASAVLLNVDDDASCQAVLRTAGQLPLDALLFLTHPLSAEQLAAIEECYPLPAIHVCRSAAEEGEAAIGVDEYAAGEQIGRLLLSQGYQRFGYLQGQEVASAPLRRMDGYAASLQGAGKTLNSVLVAGQSDREMGYKAMMAYLKTTWASERIEGLFCENDVLAFGAMQAIRDFGEGAHIGVVGFDDVSEAHSSMWSLTTWAQRSDLQINEALNRLLDQRTDAQGVWRKGELKIRHSHLSREVHGEMSQCGCASRS
ncbi:substrate-binding domain-containing protein [Erwinia sp. Eh17-17]|jgi:DNA-binding LacI/PurR family transcriptional regulator|uniref:substrate-binding domain-containing protein n=1 Tax=Erwinia sp. Eh17-17 TaxID=3080330 RepID=UPI00320A47D0